MKGLILKTGEPMRASGEEARMTSLPVGFLWGGGGGTWMPLLQNKGSSDRLLFHPFPQILPSSS